MKKFIWIFVGVLCTQTACDLQPKILSFPDSVGDFISARYPALLADPYANPEIYNSAATDYGTYASTSVYGVTEDNAYVVYASVEDYVLPTQDKDVDTGSEIVSAGQPTDDYINVPMYGGGMVADTPDDIIVVRGDTVYSLAKKYNMSVQEFASLNKLSEPYELSIGQKLRVRNNRVADVPDTLVVKKPTAGVAKATRVDLQEITVGAGDTLYSLSRKYSVPVNDLAVMNKLSAPFTLSVGQKLRVPDMSDLNVAKKQSGSDGVGKTEKVTGSVSENKSKPVVANAEPVQKISSDPSKKLPTIRARSSSKFSWPVRGKILSNYGAKSNGLFNDGINIAAKRGTPVGAAENGVVAYAGNEVKGMGNLVIIQHSDGWMTVYAHMDSMSVRRGMRVNVGHQIGAVGETGKVDKPQLHFEIRKGTKAYKPATYLKK